MSSDPGHHSIRFTIRPGGVVEANITCTAPEGADCRKTCNECDEYCSCPRDTLVDGGECLPTVWLTETGEALQEFYEGPVTDLRSGPIVIVWNRSEDSYEWAYQDGAL